MVSHVFPFDISKLEIHTEMFMSIGIGQEHTHTWWHTWRRNIYGGQSQISGVLRAPFD